MAPLRRPEIVIGLDVGKSSHWAYVAAHDDETPRQARRHRCRPIRPLRSKPIHTKRLNRGDHPHKMKQHSHIDDMHVRLNGWRHPSYTYRDDGDTRR